MDKDIYKNVTVNFFVDQIEWIRKEMYLQRRTRNEILREALSYYIEKQGDDHNELS